MTKLRVIEGEIRNNACLGCDERERRIDQLEGDLRLANQELATKRRLISALKREREDTLEAHPRRDEIVAVFEHWQGRLGKPKAKIGKRRFQAIRKRLTEGYTVEQLKLTVDGIAARPWVGREGPVTELAWYFEDETRVENWANRGARTR